jgi:hypothetical protein
MDKKTIETYYHEGKRIISKNLIAVIIISGLAAAIIGLFTMRPEILYLCTVILIVSIITLIIDNRAMNSMAIAAVPIFIIVIPLQPSFFHIFLGILVTIILFRNGKNSIPWLIIITSLFYLFYGLMIWQHVIWSPADYAFYQQVFTPGPMVFYFTSVFIIAGIIRSLQPKKKRR